MSIDELLSSPLLIRGESLSKRPIKDVGPWSYTKIYRRLTELSGLGETAVLTAAAEIVLEVQGVSGMVAWISRTESSFYPPDFHNNGVDLDALVVLRLEGAKQMIRAADRIIRSGAFSLIVVDLGARGYLSLAAEGRLQALVKKYRSALLFLTEKARGVSSLGSMISLRYVAERCKSGVDEFSYEISILKDKQAFSTGIFGEIYEGRASGPDGLY